MARTGAERDGAMMTLKPDKVLRDRFCEGEGRFRNVGGGVTMIKTSWTILSTAVSEGGWVGGNRWLDS